MKSGSGVMSDTLIDTNILVYAAGVGTAEDRARKQLPAIEALRAVRATGAVSLQVLGEYGHALVRRGVDPTDVRDQVAVLARDWPVLADDAGALTAALDGLLAHRLSYWDAVIWATAKQHGLRRILSEDGPSGATLGGIEYISLRLELT